MDWLSAVCTVMLRPLRASSTARFCNVRSENMSKLADVLKDEVRRLARKELKTLSGQTSKTLSRYRKDIAELKRQNTVQARRIAVLQARQRKLEAGGSEDGGKALRFSPRSVRTQRDRLGLSAENYGQLVGVSGVTICNWEQGKARPKAAQLAALASVRGIGKSDAVARLAEAPDPAATTKKTAEKKAAKKKVAKNKAGKKTAGKRAASKKAAAKR